MTNFINQIIKPVFADDFIGNIGSNLPTGIPSDISVTTSFISAIVRFLVIIAGLFTLWQFLTGGFGMITAGGDKGKVAEAQNKLTTSLTGLVVIASSFLIIGIISQLLFGDYKFILAPSLQSVEPHINSIPKP